MINYQKLAEIFKSNNLCFFTGVPCSIFKDWLNFVENNKDFQHIRAVSEAEACSIAAGFHLTTNKIPVIYMQNSGLGNSVDPLTSLMNKEMYNIPALVLISWRGQPGTNDAPQHEKMGRITTKLLEALEIPYSIFSSEQDIERAVQYIKQNSLPFALIIRKETTAPLKREQAIRTIVDNLTEQDIIVSTTGKTSRELNEIKAKNPQFYNLGSMGCSAGIGLGIALQKPDKKVFVFDGDGSVLMKMGSLATIGNCGPKNFYHIVFDNNAHDSTGGQKTSSDTVDFAKVALACNYKSGQTVSTEDQLIKSLKALDQGPAMLVIKIEKGARKDLSRPDKRPIVYKNQFTNLVRRETMKTYYLPTKIIWGRLEDNIRQAIDSFNARKILLITSAGRTNKILDYLSEYQVIVFNKVKPNPSPEIAEEAKQEADLIIGFGGGSVMDVAKVVATDLDKPCIAIPTTAGTGSEVTPFAALYTNEKKISFTGKYPDIALVDYRLTLTMPKELTASTGMDALSQAIEAYWSIHSTLLTDVHAKMAIELAINNLEASWHGDEPARKAMSLAALEAGRAFSHTKTTAVHSVSYPFSVFYKMPHGLACALTLPHFFRYNCEVTENDCLDKRGPEFVKNRMKEIADFLRGEEEVILDLMQSIEVPEKAEFDIDLILKNGFSPERVANNPRKLTQEKLREILTSLAV